jgi:hypothetical protein
LLEWRNMPRSDGLSPAQWLFGRAQRTRSPAISSAYNRISDHHLAEAEARRGEIMEAVKQRYDSHTQELPELSPGMNVLVQDPRTKKWTQTAEIIESRKNKKSFLISLNGKEIVRNRRFLKPLL